MLRGHFLPRQSGAFQVAAAKRWRSEPHPRTAALSFLLCLNPLRCSLSFFVLLKTGSASLPSPVWAGIGFKIDFIMDMCLHELRHTHAGAGGGQKQVLGPLELKLQVSALGAGHPAESSATTLAPSPSAREY